MEKTLIKRMPDELPSELRTFIGCSDVYDSSCSPEASVYFIDKDTGYYLKRSAQGTLNNEAKMTEFFFTKGLGAEPLAYLSAEEDWFLTRALPGNDCTHEAYLKQPKRLCDTIAIELRKLHEVSFAGCPVPDRTKDHLALADANYRAGRFDASLFSGRYACTSAEEAHAILSEGREALQDKVLLHGDYCLPNIILDDWRLSGFIDVGFGGVGDRHIDLFWGVWTLAFNLGTEAYHDRFLDAYGRDKIDESLLKVVAAAEVFG